MRRWAEALMTLSTFQAPLPFVMPRLSKPRPVGERIFSWPAANEGLRIDAFCEHSIGTTFARRTLRVLFLRHCSSYPTEVTGRVELAPYHASLPGGSLSGPRKEGCPALSYSRSLQARLTSPRSALNAQEVNERQ